MGLRQYHWGIQRKDGNVLPFVVRGKAPDGAIAAYPEACESSGVGLLIEKSENLAADYSERQNKNQVNVAGPVMPGDVVNIADGEGNHFAVVLRIGVATADVAIVSSRPTWADRYRQATEDELSLMGFARTKKTFLCLARRDLLSFHKLGVQFPVERTEELEAQLGLGRATSP